MDTDAFVIHIKEGNIFPKFNNLKDKFDFSDYPKEHFLHSNTNKKVVGKFKDELSGNFMTKFVALRSKMYSFTTLNEKKDKKICKGISRSLVEKELKFDDYLNCLLNNVSNDLTFRRITSSYHNMYTDEVTKKGLSPIDDKNYYIDNIHRKPYD